MKLIETFDNWGSLSVRINGEMLTPQTHTELMIQWPDRSVSHVELKYRDVKRDSSMHSPLPRWTTSAVPHVAIKHHGMEILLSLYELARDHELLGSFP